MTQKVIYHDFRQDSGMALETERPTVLTAGVLARGRRWFKAWENLNAVSNAACLVLCGACIAASVFTLVMVCVG